MKPEELKIDLSDLALEDVEVLAQEGARAIPEFAASCKCCSTCSTQQTSTAVEEAEDAPF